MYIIDLAILVALDSLGGLTGDDATDSSSAISDSNSGGRAKAVNHSSSIEKGGDNGNDDKDIGEMGKIECHLRDWNRAESKCRGLSGFLFFIES